ncbi:MAG: hypothetical protein WCF33_21580 [Pseudonocardiaceae bacterium]
MAADRLTKAQQETSVGEGLAVGCLAIGVLAVTSEKMAVELAFVRAWRKWAWSSRFPTIHATHARNDLLRILHDSPRRRRSVLAEWSSDHMYQPYLREDWEVEEASESLESWTGVPLRGWVELARAFVEDLGEAKIWHAGVR